MYLSVEPYTQQNKTTDPNTILFWVLIRLQETTFTVKDTFNFFLPAILYEKLTQFSCEH